jgi:hypothetical protein
MATLVFGLVYFCAAIAFWLVVLPSIVAAMDAAMDAAENGLRATKTNDRRWRGEKP